MYVIFPADEIVYLSYGRLIYVPSTPEPENQLRTPPIRTSLEDNQLFYPGISENSPSQRESIASSESDKAVKSSKSKNKEKSKNDVYSIGSRSIDLETRESSEKIRIDGINYERRRSSEQREKSEQLKSTSVKSIPAPPANLTNKSSFFLKRYATNRSSKNIPSEPSTSGYNSLERNKCEYKFNEPENIQPLQSTGSLNRFGTLRKAASLNKTGATTVQSLDTSSRLSTPTRVLKPKSQQEVQNIAIRNSATKESTSFNRFSTPNRSFKTKSPVETESFGSRTLEAQEYNSTKGKSPNKFLKAREAENLNKTLERGSTGNSNKSSKSSKNSSSSSKSVGAVKTKQSAESKELLSRPRTLSESGNSPKAEPKKKLTNSNSFRSFLKPSALTKEKVPEPPVRPERKKDKKSDSSDSRRLSYSDYLALNRERVPRSDIINTRSDKVQELRVKPLPKREKSPVLKFFRAQSSSPRNFGRDRTAFDFDGFFKQEPASPGKLSVNSTPNKSPPIKGIPLKTFGSETNLAGRQSEKSPAKKKQFFQNVRGAVTSKKASALENDPAKMAGNESPLKDLIHPSYNEHLKSHNAVSFKLIRTVSDFTQQLGQMYEHHAEELQMLVANFRKRNGELRKERPACPSSLFHTWETLLQEVEIDSQALGDIASILGRQVSRPLLERSFHRKIQSRKVFSHRESYETIIAKTEEKLAKCRQEYKSAYLAYLAAPSTESLSAYFNTHNAYIQQLHATNGMMDEFGKSTLPSLLQELEDIYVDLCSTVTDAVLQGAEVVSNRSMEQCRRYESLISQCKAVSGTSDLNHLARSLPVPGGRGPILKRLFVPPQPPPPTESVDGEMQDLPHNDNIPPPLRDELVIDKLSAVQLKPSHDVLHKEALDLEAQIRQIHDAVDTLLRIQQKSVEASLYNKANELQEDISMKRFDLRVAQLHLSAINSQKELFSNKLEGETVTRERKMSSASTASMKNKWLKAFKSLKTPPPEAEPKKNGAAATRELLKGDPDAHNFQEYTYKKITPCDVCSQVLRGHTRQGLKCRICKMNVHMDCLDKASKCQTKARLLRRQKSTSEIETRVPELNPDDERVAAVFSMPTINRRLSMRNNNQLHPNLNNAVVLDYKQGPSTPNSAPIMAESTSMRRRLFAGMKSLTGFGSRSRHGSPGHRSISLPEKRNSQDGSGNRPFGQPLLLGPQLENGNGLNTPPSPSSSTPKGKISPVATKRTKPKK
ncbi:uncharacterized protein Stacl isoform X2 [Diabrotica undecimpunctata]|uniref:uncharacterized protein Stacl isoform X2 n=1 Tax=Diabrotica undecimpunctata TaxID=50387 RepID=UPI003B632B46